MNRALPVLEEDNRLVSLVQNLDKRYTGEDYSSAKTGERLVGTSFVDQKLIFSFGSDRIRIHNTCKKEKLDEKSIFRIIIKFFLMNLLQLFVNGRY